MIMAKDVQHQKEIPTSIKDKTNWQLNRKQFIGVLLTGGAATQLPNLRLFGKTGPKNDILSPVQFEIVQSIQEILFPADGNGPGAKDINAAEYLVWVLSDQNKDPGDVKYILDGIGWVDETAEELFSKKYPDLSQEEKENLIANIAKEDWGKSWLSVILTFIFEALLSDPQYGGNPDNIGWKWLEYIPGQPRPTPKLLYPEILNTVKQQ
jgi:gluconate 2-dehydrogenase gamma chain